MNPSYAATLVVDNKSRSLDNGTFVIRVRSLVRIRPKPNGERVVNHSRNTATTRHVEGSPTAERKHRSPFEILATEEIAVTIINMATGEPWQLDNGSVVEELAAQAELQPEMKYFIAHVIVPILVRRYIADSKGPSTPQSEVEE